MYTIHSLTPNLMVNDVAYTIKFYKEKLGFELAQTVPEEAPFVWAMMKKEGMEIMFQTRESLIEDLPAFETIKPGASLTLFIKVNGIESIYEKLQNKVQMVSELKETFYAMKEFTFKDCNGYILTFAEPIEA
ncbi:VOC family protein [Fulvivirgaceae bacterium LMO-SS25]